ncbi:MAG: phosphorylase family protein [Promethearchaeota archaeon]
MFDKFKMGLLNFGLKFISVDEKIVRLFLETKPSSIKKIVIMPAVKDVMKKIVNKLKNKTIHGRVYNGFLNGIQVSVIRSLIGCPHTAITLECFKRADVKIVIRVDVCGGIKNSHNKIDIGDIIIPNIAYCGDGTTPYYISRYFKFFQNNNKINNPIEKFLEMGVGGKNIFIAKPNNELKEIFIKTGKNLFSDKIKQTDLWTIDALFCESEDLIEDLRKINVGAIDMESSILFLLGQLYNFKVVSILAVSDLPADNKYDLLKSNAIHPELEHGVNNAIKLVIESLPKIDSLLKTS